jgi:hypothetical protein
MVRRSKIGVIATFVLLALACERTDESLARRMTAAATADGDPLPHVLTMRALTDFEWDRMVALKPYMTSAQVEKDLGCRWSLAGIMELTDSFIVVVFVHRGRVTRFVELKHADFHYRPGGYTPQTAVFRCQGGMCWPAG